jgi:exodeoxyribonuclease-5/exodeoxyribonuclease V alpha subunit
MFRLAWAMTVHRAQGSEYPAVVLVYDHRAHGRFATLPEYALATIGPMLDRRVLYTAITRCKAHLTLVGTIEAVRRTATRASYSGRHTSLGRQLATILPPVSA